MDSEIVVFLKGAAATYKGGRRIKRVMRI